MKIITTLLIGSLAVIACAPSVAFSQQPQTKAEIDVLEMKSVPEGHYLLNLNLRGSEQLINVQVKDGAAYCVNTSDPALKGLHGKFELVGNGVFRVFLQNKTHRASQYWLFRKDGTAVIQEVPDRGEKQMAVPVPGSSLKQSL